MALVFRGEGFAAVKADLAAVRGRISNTRRARVAIGEELLSANEARLSRGVDFEGRKMKPSRRVAQFGGQTMIDHSILQGSVSYDVGGDGLDLFSSDKRARVHWEGLTIKPKGGKKFLTIVFRDESGQLQFRRVKSVKMPQRRWFGISTADMDAAEDVLTKHILRGDV